MLACRGANGETRNVEAGFPGLLSPSDEPEGVTSRRGARAEKAPEVPDQGPKNGSRALKAPGVTPGGRSPRPNGFGAEFGTPPKRQAGIV